MNRSVTDGHHTWPAHTVALAAIWLTSCARAPAAVATARTMAPTAPTTEVGELAGAPFRIDIPAGWNGGLMLYCHGYRGAPVRFDQRQPDEMAGTFGALGYAVAQSGYSAGGQAVREGVRDTEALRLYFATRFGVPTETWVSGSSLGGSITMILMETHPTTYDGGLSLCAPLGPMLGYAKTLVFDQLVVFEFLFPGHLPSPAHVPADFVTTFERTALLEQVLDANPEAAATLRRFSLTKTNKEQAANLDLFAHILAELQRRWGGNAFDNRDTIYAGSGDDVRLNDGVRRYAADDRARALAIRDYTPTGRLARPLLSVRAVYDPLIGAYPSDRYPEIAQLAGSGELFAQQYVRREGHCAFEPSEIATAFTALRRWRQTGVRPHPGAVETPKL